MRIILWILICLAVMSCEHDYSRAEVNALNAEAAAVTNRLNNTKSMLDAKYAELKGLQAKASVLEKKLEGKIPHYVLMLELKQSHFTLGIGKHLKDEMNAVTFPIEVSESYYEKCYIGKSIMNEFRGGSMVFSGSFGDWGVKVVDKKIWWENE